MTTLRQTCLLLALCCISTLGLAQLDTRQPSSLDSRTQDSQRPLPLDQAFPFYVSETAADTFRVTWTPAPGHYLYRHAFQFALQAGAATASEALAVTIPPGLRKTDQFFGDIEAYYEPVSITVTVPPSARANGVLLIQYQGCADWGFCYPPQRREFPLLP